MNRAMNFDGFTAANLQIILGFRKKALFITNKGWVAKITHHVISYYFTLSHICKSKIVLLYQLTCLKLYIKNSKIKVLSQLRSKNFMESAQSKNKNIKVKIDLYCKFDIRLKHV